MGHPQTILRDKEESETEQLIFTTVDFYESAEKFLDHLICAELKVLMAPPSQQYQRRASWPLNAYERRRKKHDFIYDALFRVAVEINFFELKILYAIVIGKRKALKVK